MKNRLFDELKIGDAVSAEWVCRPDDLIAFAHASGNFNPLGLPWQDQDRDGAHDAAQAPAMWAASLISGVLATRFPGPGMATLHWQHDVHGHAILGETLAISVTIAGKSPPDRVDLDAAIRGADDRLLLTARAGIRAPLVRIEYPEIAVPDLLVQRHRHIERLMNACAGLPPLPCAVVAPEEEAALGGALLAAERRLIVPRLVGDAARIRACAQAHGFNLDGFDIVQVDGDAEAKAQAAVALVNAGEAAALMKGHLHTDQLLRHVVKKDGGLRGSRRLSHVFIMDVPSLPHLLLVTDAAINIVPDLEAKVDITQNAIDLGRALGIATPKAAILSAVEVVNPKIPSTLDAAVLSKMADRGQIRGGLVDGPLAMDNALSIAAAKTKGITSLVAGKAEILVAPNMESGNMLAKELAYAAGAEGAGVVVGAKVPIMLTSRADDEMSRLASCAVAALYHHWLKTGTSAVESSGE